MFVLTPNLVFRKSFTSLRNKKNLFLKHSEASQDWLNECKESLNKKETEKLSTNNVDTKFDMNLAENTKITERKIEERKTITKSNEMEKNVFTVEELSNDVHLQNDTHVVKPFTKKELLPADITKSGGEINKVEAVTYSDKENTTKHDVFDFCVDSQNTVPVNKLKNDEDGINKKRIILKGKRKRETGKEEAEVDQNSKKVKITKKAASKSKRYNVLIFDR